MQEKRDIVPNGSISSLLPKYSTQLLNSLHQRVLYLVRMLAPLFCKYPSIMISLQSVVMAADVVVEVVDDVGLVAVDDDVGRLLVLFRRLMKLLVELLLILLFSLLWVLLLLLLLLLILLCEMAPFSVLVIVLKVVFVVA